MSSIDNVQKEFENWFINIHGDVDESLIEGKTEDGKHYTNETVDEAWFCFKAGYARS